MGFGTGWLDRITCQPLCRKAAAEEENVKTLITYRKEDMHGKMSTNIEMALNKITSFDMMSGP